MVGNGYGDIMAFIGISLSAAFAGAGGSSMLQTASGLAFDAVAGQAASGVWAGADDRKSWNSSYWQLG